MAPVGTARLEQAEPLAAWSGPHETVWLCLYHGPVDGIYGILLGPLETLADFRAAKRVAMQQLQARGFDACHVVWWVGPTALELRVEDVLEHPLECPPRIIPADAGAVRWLPHVSAAVTRIVAASTSDLAWRPTRPLTIVVVTDAEAAMCAYRHYVLSGFRAPEDYVAQVANRYERSARRGVSTFVDLAATGSAIFLNLSLMVKWDASSDAVLAAIDRSLAHEVSHFAQHVILGTGKVPAWFEEGQAVHWERQFVGGRYENLVFVADAQRKGTGPSLAQLSPRQEYDDALSAGPHGRGYAAVAYLAQHYGFAATVQLLHDNRDGNLQHFDELLADLTGADLDTLDQAVGDWLLAPGQVMFRDDFSVPSGYWPRWADPTSQYGHDGAEYAVVKPAGSDDGAWGLPVAPLGEFEAEVQARLRPPTLGGVICLEFNVPHTGGLYRYQVEPANRAFALEHRVRGAWRSVLDWTPTAAIHGDTASNRLALRVTRSEIVLRANGLELARLPAEPEDASQDVGLLAITVGHREDGWAEARFSELVVTNTR